MTVRIGTIQKWFRTTSKAAVATVGLQDFEYETLHALMIRDTPGRASPGAAGGRGGGAVRESTS